MPKIDIKTDFESFSKAIAHVPTDAAKQYAFGMSKVGREARDAARDAFDENYIERNRFLRGSIISTTANPRRLAVQVGTYNYLLHLHMFGGKKSGNVAVKGLRGDDKRGKVLRGQTVDQINKAMAKPGSHEYFEREVKGRTYIFQKIGGTVDRKRKRNGYTGKVFASTPIVPVWLLRDGQSIAIKPDWRLVEVVNHVLTTRAPVIMTEIIEDAWNHAVKKGKVAFQF